MVAQQQQKLELCSWVSDYLLLMSLSHKVAEQREAKGLQRHNKNWGGGCSPSCLSVKNLARAFHGTGFAELLWSF